jgi:hypothetical protein
MNINREDGMTDSRTDAYSFDMDAAWDWTGPADPDVLEMQSRLADAPDDLWLARAYWTDAWNNATEGR